MEKKECCCRCNYIPLGQLSGYFVTEDKTTVDTGLTAVGRVDLFATISVDWNATPWTDVLTSYTPSNNDLRRVSEHIVVDFYFKDEFKFTPHPGESWGKNLLHETGPGFIADGIAHFQPGVIAPVGEYPVLSDDPKWVGGVPFFIRGEFRLEFNTVVAQRHP